VRRGLGYGTGVTIDQGNEVIVMSEQNEVYDVRRQGRRASPNGRRMGAEVQELVSRDNLELEGFRVLGPWIEAYRALWHAVDATDCRVMLLGVHVTQRYAEATDGKLFLRVYHPAGSLQRELIGEEDGGVGGGESS